MYYLRRRVFNKNFSFRPANSDPYIFSISNSEQSREFRILARVQSIIQSYLHFFSGELSCVEKCFSYKVLRTEMCYSDIRGIRRFRIVSGRVLVSEYESIELNR